MKKHALPSGAQDGSPNLRSLNFWVEAQRKFEWGGLRGQELTSSDAKLDHESRRRTLRPAPNDERHPEFCSTAKLELCSVVLMLFVFSTSPSLCAAAKHNNSSEEHLTQLVGANVIMIHAFKVPLAKVQQR